MKPDDRKVLFLDHAAGVGGAEISLLDTMAGLRRTGWDPHLCCPEGELHARAIALGIAVHEFAFPRLRGNRDALRALKTTADRLKRLCTELGALCLAANTVRTAIILRYAAPRLGRPWLWYMRDFWLSESRPGIILPDRIGKWWIGSNAARIIANSRAVAGNLPLQRNVQVVYNGIDASIFVASPDKANSKRRLGLSPSAPVIGAAGRLRPWKGFDRFLRSAAWLARNRPDAQFVIAGGTPFGDIDGYASDLHKMARELGLQDKVLFTGQVEDIRLVLDAMDIFVHAGDPEPFGRVVIEAMAMGLPIVGFDHGALPEIVIDGETGFLVPPAHPSELGDPILRLVEDSDLRRRLGAAGQRRVEESFSLKSNVQRIAGALEGICGKRRRPPAGRPIA